MEHVGWLAVAFLFWAFFFTWRISKIEFDVYRIKLMTEEVRDVIQRPPAAAHPQPAATQLKAVAGIRKSPADLLKPANSCTAVQAKVGALLQYVSQTESQPEDLSSATKQVWNALLFLDLVRQGKENRVWLTPGGRALLAASGTGDY